MSSSLCSIHFDKQGTGYSLDVMQLAKGITLGMHQQTLTTKCSSVFRWKTTHNDSDPDSDKATD